jgi:two-component system response regulator CpxR
MTAEPVNSPAREERVLIIDDDTELCELVTEYLEMEGFGVEVIHDGTHAVERAVSGSYRLIILDVMLPGANGFEVLRKIRSQSQIPVLMLTARGEDVDRIVGLEVGADDYLPKPFNPRELVARIRAILRRTHGDGSQGTPPQPESLSLGDIDGAPSRPGFGIDHGRVRTSGGIFASSWIGHEARETGGADLGSQLFSF